MTDLDLDAILTRAEQAYAAAKNDADDLGLSELTTATQLHFEHDVPALVGAVRDLTAARHWIVARDGGRFCEGCEWEIRRGEAYELLPGSGGLLQHVHCGDPYGPGEVVHTQDANGVHRRLIITSDGPAEVRHG